MILSKLKSRIFYLLCLIILSCGGCETEQEYELLSGKLIGHVSLYNSKRELLTDKSGVEVLVEGNNKQKTVTTNETGLFVVDSLSTGTYNLIFAKDGFVPFKKQGHTFIGGSETSSAYRISLFERLRCEINNLAITDIYDYHNIKVYFRADIIPEEEGFAYFRYYISDKPDVSYKNYKKTGSSFEYLKTEMIIGFQVDTELFPSGSQVYLIVYPALDSSSYYTDTDTALKIYSSVNGNMPSDIIQFTVPEIRTTYSVNPNDKLK